MSASTLRGQLERKRAQRSDAEKKANQFRAKESTKRAEADKARQKAGKATNETTARSRLREAVRRDDEAAAAGKEATRWSTRAAGYGKDELALASRLARAEQTERLAVERERQRQLDAAARRAAQENLAMSERIAQTESAVGELNERLPAPQPEKLRILTLASNTDGRLRVDREHKRIRDAVRSANHRDQIELDYRPAAGIEDLLDGITQFRPHVIHFSGHSGEDVLVLEEDTDVDPSDISVSASAFAAALQAVDSPPLLVVLNSCDSAAQLERLVNEVVPFAIGMADEIGDGDAIAFAARFYASIANGQSIHAAHAVARAALQLSGLDGADLPVLRWADDVDPTTAVLVTGE